MAGMVLFVDDTKLMRKMAEVALASAGYETLVAGDGQEALSLLQQYHDKIGLVLTDWHMPLLDGFGLLKSIKGSDKLKHIPVIMVTSDSEKGQARKAMDAGAAGYLVKPFSNYDEVIEAVRQHSRA